MHSSCPFCNTVLPTLSAAPQRDKLPCPRCGEPIPRANWPVDVSHQVAAGPPSALRPGATWPADRNAPIPDRMPAPGKGKTLLAIFGIMLLMATLGLTYALWTKPLRRSRDPKKQEILQPISVRRPLELTGLGYLPPGCQIILGMQIAEILQENAGKELLAAPRPQILDWILKQIPRTTGLKLEEIDHILAAVSFDAQFPQVFLVVKTRLKVSLEKIAETHPTTSSLYQDRALYGFSLKPYGEALVWCVEDHTLLYVIRTDTPKFEHLRGLSVKERPVRELLSAPLYETLESRLAKHQLIWVVGRLDQLGPLKDLLPLFLGEKANLRPLLDVRRFGLGLEATPLNRSVPGATGSQLTLTGHFQLDDPKKAPRLQALLEGFKIDGASSQKVEAPSPDDPEPWLTWQVRGDVAVMRAFLNQDFQGKK